MTDTVTLVRIRSGFVNVPDSFEVYEPGRVIDELREETDTWSLPDGYTVDRAGNGALAIYDPHGTYCEIAPHPSGRPQLISGFGKGAPVLKKEDRPR